MRNHVWNLGGVWHALWAEIWDQITEKKNMHQLVEDMSKIDARSLPRVYAIFLSTQPRLNLLSTQQQGRAPQTEK